MSKKRKNMRAIMLTLMTMLSLSISAQTVTLTGNVRDNSGESVIGVTVLEKGTTNGAITDVDGNFSLKATGNGVLVISYTGMKTQTIDVKGKTNFSIVLEDDTKMLDELVVIGYGTVKRRDLTGSVSSMKGNDIKSIPSQNPLEAIQGKIAGADISRNSGSASSGVSITIRGNRSIGAGNNPLYIVDGIQASNISNINPNDIESMEFLKDASSTAIYGWQGANGVIIITTKKGNIGKPKVTFNAYYGTSEVSRYPSVMNGPEFADLKREANRTIGKWNSAADDPKIFTNPELEAINNNQWVDYQDLLFHKGAQQNYQVGISSGTEQTKTYMSVDYYNEKGILKFDEVTRYSFRTNVDHKLSNWISTGLQSQFVYRNESYRRDPLNMANKIRPLGTVYDSDGKFIVFPLGGSATNPLADEQPNTFSNTGKSMNVIANAYVEIKPLAGLSIRSNLGSNIAFSREGLFDASNSLSRGGGNSLAKYSTKNSYFINWDNIATYKKEINNHSFTLTALTSYVENVGESSLAQGESQLVPDQLFFALSNTREAKTVGSSYEKWNVFSYAARFNYSFKGKYLLTLTGRSDGASRLSKGNKWAFFPSIAGAWRISDEHFMENAKTLSDLKLRLSYGVAGNSAIEAYGTQSTLTRVPMAYGETSAQGFTFSPLVGNLNTGWEMSATTNLGLDFGMFRNKVLVTVDLYNTKTTDLLLPRGLPPTSGLEKTYQNIGETRNRGIEVAINTTNIETKDITWTSTFTFSSNQEKIISLVTKGIDDIGNGWFIGHPTSVFYDYEKIGIWQADEAAEAAKYKQVPGDIKVRDLDESGSIDATNDRKVLAGDNRPKWYGGLNNKINYKGFDLSFYFFARWGQTISPAFLARYDRQGALENTGKIINYWTPENPSNDYPRPNVGTSMSSTLYKTTLGYVDGSYIKLRNVSLGYTLPKFRNLPLERIKVYVTGSNLLTWTKSSKLKEYDPERGGGETFPMTRNFVFGVNIDF